MKFKEELEIVMRKVLRSGSIKKIWSKFLVKFIKMIWKITRNKENFKEISGKIRLQL